MFYCKFLDLPQIPLELLTNLSNADKGTMIRDYKGWTHTNNGKEVVSADNPFYSMSAELEQWLQENICNDYNDVGIRYAYGSREKHTAGVHTDQTRRYVLQYLVETGSGVLNFWQEAGHDIVRDGRYTPASFDQLTLLESFDLPTHQWALLNTNILHSVEGLTGNRISVQISLNYNPFP